MGLKTNIAVVVLSALIGIGCEFPKTRTVTVTWREYYIKEDSYNCCERKPCNCCGRKDTSIYYREDSQLFYIRKYSDMTEINWGYGTRGAIIKNDSTPPYSFHIIPGKLPLFVREKNLGESDKRFFNNLLTHNEDEYIINDTDPATMNRINEIQKKKQTIK